VVFLQISYAKEVVFVQIIRVKLVVSHRNVDQGGQAPQSVQFKLKTGFPMNNLLPLLSHRVSKHLVFNIGVSIGCDLFGKQKFLPVCQFCQDGFSLAKK
jgi:hypothetical protein